MQENIINNSNMIIEQRKKLTLTGVKDCLSFDEETIKEEVDFSKMRNFNLPQTMTIGMEIECEGLLADEILKCIYLK